MTQDQNPTDREVAWPQVKARLESIHKDMLALERALREQRPCPRFNQILSRAQAALDAALLMAGSKGAAAALAERQHQAREADRTGIPQPLSPRPSSHVAALLKPIRPLEPDLLIEAKRKSQEVKKPNHRPMP